MRPFQLELYLRQIFGDGGTDLGILAGAPTSFRNFIHRIDNLTEWQVHQRIPIHLAGELPGLRANCGALVNLAKAVEHEVAGLPELIRSATGKGV